MMRISTGIPGLDSILKGGLIPSRTYIVRGGPGVGKTITGMHFLGAGLDAGDSSLFITFDQSELQVRSESRVLGLDLSKAAFLDLSPDVDTFTDLHTYDIFSPAEVERDPFTRAISEKIDKVRPRRIFIDGFSQFCHLASDGFHLRRLVQSFFRYATQSGATLLASSDESDNTRDRYFQSAADGVFTLEYSGLLRTVHVTKFRGSDFQNGPHIMRLTDAGVEVVPTAA
jgi:circadian clock protein KaiC